MKVFSISGYWADEEPDYAEFSGYLVAELDCTPKGYSDDEIFFYGMSEEQIKEAIKTKDNGDGFVITGYEIEPQRVLA